VDKSKYKELRKKVDKEVKGQLNEDGKVAVAPGYFHHSFCPSQEVELAWMSIVRDLGLIPDGLGMWTLPGKGYVLGDALTTFTDKSE